MYQEYKQGTAEFLGYGGGGAGETKGGGWEKGMKDGGELDS